MRECLLIPIMYTGKTFIQFDFVPDPLRIYSCSSKKNATILRTLNCQTGEQTQSVSDRGIYSADVESHQLLLY